MKVIKSNSRIRLGLCCVFYREPIRFRTTTATHLMELDRPEALNKVSGISLDNAVSLKAALKFCARNRIGAFRIKSDILPVRTHPDAGYRISQLPESDKILSVFEDCRLLGIKNDIRLTFHPDQFVVLNSPRSEVVSGSLQELEHHGQMAELLGADTINIHAGGVYGDKEAALKRLESNIGRLSGRVRKRLTLENDDRSYSPADLLPVCLATDIPLVYDLHHHRCLPDGLSVDEATFLAIATWNREPLFHISSPLKGWDNKNPQMHHDYIDINDFPDEWLDLEITVDVEAKAKELAVLKLRRELDFV